MQKSKPSARSPVDALPGLGPKARDALARHGVRAVADLVWVLPIALDDLSEALSVEQARARADQAAEGGGATERVVVRGIVKSASLVPMRGRRMVRVVVGDESEPARTVHASWFFAAHGVLAEARVGRSIALIGRVRAVPKRPPSMAHPDVVSGEARSVRPRYPRVGIGDAALRRAIADAFRILEEEARLGSSVADVVPNAVARRLALPAVLSELRAVHAIEAEHQDATERVAAPHDAAATLATLRARAGYGVMFANAWARLEAARCAEREASPEAAVAREPAARRGASPIPFDAAVYDRFVSASGFAPTKAQALAVADVARDLASGTPMRRLLLGDVGTGKTFVALAAAALVLAAGYQVAILAPTTLLAEQYRTKLEPLVAATGARIALVGAGASSDGPPRGAGEAAADERARVARGEANVALGTHALFSEKVTFARLGLVIIDEQQRLGVAQRLALAGKGAAPHVLTLSATPIPRSLALALRGELATSELRERPAGRGPVTTDVVYSDDALGAAFDAIHAACARGERVFFVAPRIEDDADDDAGAGSTATEGAAGGAARDGLPRALGAVARAKQLARRLGRYGVALVHGAMPAELRRQALSDFRRGVASVLVGTTVLEVGLDVPEATLMVIDRADRLGLAQLHQLRGRVGRGPRPARCVAIAPEVLDAHARARLEAFAASQDGFALAQADLAMRGAGDLSGTRQSGETWDALGFDPWGALPPPYDAALATVDADARALFAVDPGLEQPEHLGLRLLVERVKLARAFREDAA